MDWECCWTTEEIEPGKCPYIAEDERELYTSLKQRLLDKCLECPKFKDDLKTVKRNGISCSGSNPASFCRVSASKGTVALSGRLSEQQEQGDTVPP